eukprot:606735-Amphidinium_carterae.1
MVLVVGIVFSAVSTVTKIDCGTLSISESHCLLPWCLEFRVTGISKALYSSPSQLGSEGTSARA